MKFSAIALCAALAASAAATCCVRPERARAGRGSASPPAPALEPKAMEILKATSEKLASAKTMAFTAVSTYERAARNGQPLYYSSIHEVTLERPDKLRVITPGDGTPDEFYYDGKTMMAYVPSKNVVAVSDAPPTDRPASRPRLGEGRDLLPLRRRARLRPDGGTVEDAEVGLLRRPLDRGRRRADRHDRARGRRGGGGGVDRRRTTICRCQVRVVYANEPAQARYQTVFSDWRLDLPVEPAEFANPKALKAEHIDFAPPGDADAAGRGQPAAGGEEAMSRVRSGGHAMKALMLAATAALAVAAAIEPAGAWMRGGGGFGGSWGHTAGGGFYHEGDAGGFDARDRGRAGRRRARERRGRLLARERGQRLRRVSRQRLRRLLPWDLRQPVWRVSHRRLRRLLSSAGGGELLRRRAATTAATADGARRPPARAVGAAAVGAARLRPRRRSSRPGRSERRSAICRRAASTSTVRCAPGTSARRAGSSRSTARTASITGSCRRRCDALCGRARRGARRGRRPRPQDARRP